MKQSHFENEISNKYELLKEMETETTKNKDLSNLKEDEQQKELEKIKYSYFRKGYIIKCLEEEN